MKELQNEGYWRRLINQGLIKFFLLKVLYKDRESYGYKIVQRIEEMSEGLCRPTESTIYPALDELKIGKYVETNWVSAGNRKRKIYILTAEGRAAYRAAAKAYSTIIPVLRENTLL